MSATIEREESTDTATDTKHGLTLGDVDFLRYLRGFLTERAAIEQCADLTRRIEELFPPEQRRYS